MVRVLPLPAPAKTKSGPSKWATACFCGSFSSGIPESRLHRARAGASPRGCIGVQTAPELAHEGAGRPASWYGAADGRRARAGFGVVGGGGAAAALAVAGAAGARAFEHAARASTVRRVRAGVSPPRARAARATAVLHGRRRGAGFGN